MHNLSLYGYSNIDFKLSKKNEKFIHKTLSKQEMLYYIPKGKGNALKNTNKDSDLFKILNQEFYIIIDDN